MGLKSPAVVKVAALLSFLLVVGLSGCGQKGDLYREAPSKEPLAKSAEPTPVPISETSGQAR
ncbi:LPS translocon maturation chaperone LptM [Marinobacter psychrophilus]|jgi:predicted small lipoprotein YifL|uniref:LPS translocon maturation chaperone LptM n=1 Tax=Marinobacter psychrophilus TaxID=330734 RepID=UPI001B47D394|nr:lipoprotein [Marinobacter psychrophilus]MBQ0762623.1 lipoprotein [Marinobacter psychrophilus]MBQ0845761.1 lipoprotein [Marinobacter psychrophilus]